MSIYKIANNVDNKVFIGATMGDVKTQLNNRYRNANNDKTDPISEHIRLHGEKAFSIIRLDEYKISTKEEMREAKEKALMSMPKEILLNKHRISRRKGETKSEYNSRYITDIAKDQNRLKHLQERRKKENKKYVELRKMVTV